MTTIALDNGKPVIRDGKIGSGQECCCDCVDPSVPGCTNPDSPNYNPAATCDDGSCLTCCNQGKCVIADPDCGSQCRSLTAPNGCNDNGDTETTGACEDCCDSFCQDGCPDADPPLLAPNDCSPTFASSYTVPACKSCTGESFTYHNCYDCDYSPPP